MSDYRKGNNRAIIVCAAIKCGLIVICGARHWDNIMSNTYKLLPPEKPKGAVFEQGFIDQFGNFYTREEALHHVVFVSQQETRTPRHRLKLAKIIFSEDLY